MRLAKVSFVGVLALACSTAPAWAQNPGTAPGKAPPAGAWATPSPENLAVAREIVATAWPPEQREAMMDKILAGILTQLRAAVSMDEFKDPGLRKIVDDYFDSIPARLRPSVQAFLPKQMEAIAGAYARQFTLQELNDVKTFAHTPSGREFLRRSTDVTSDPQVAAANSTYFAETLSISQAGAVELKDKITAYLTAQAQATPKPT